MAIADLNSLSASIKTWCARTQSSSFNSQIETFVAMAEQRMREGAGKDRSDPLFCEPLRAPELETSVTVTTDASSRAALPTDITSLVAVTRSSDKLGLDYLPPKDYARRLTVGGPLPGYYTVEGMTLKVAPAYQGDLTVSYVAQVPALTVSAPTNAILTAYPLLYLEGCLHEAFSFIQDRDAAMGHFARYRAMVEGVNGSSNRVRYGGGPLRMRLGRASP